MRNYINAETHTKCYYCMLTIEYFINIQINIIFNVYIYIRLIPKCEKIVIEHILYSYIRIIAIIKALHI